jgi:hypothetical protein
MQDKANWLINILYRKSKDLRYKIFIQAKNSLENFIASINTSSVNFKNCNMNNLFRQNLIFLY